MAETRPSLSSLPTEIQAEILEYTAVLSGLDHPYSAVFALSSTNRKFRSLFLAREEALLRPRMRELPVGWENSEIVFCAAMLNVLLEAHRVLQSQVNGVQPGTSSWPQVYTFCRERDCGVYKQPKGAHVRPMGPGDSRFRYYNRSGYVECVSFHSEHDFTHIRPSLYELVKLCPLPYAPDIHAHTSQVFGTYLTNYKQHLESRALKDAHEALFAPEFPFQALKKIYALHHRFSRHANKNFEHLTYALSKHMRNRLGRFGRYLNWEAQEFYGAVARGILGCGHAEGRQLADVLGVQLAAGLVLPGDFITFYYACEESKFY